MKQYFIQNRIPCGIRLCWALLPAIQRVLLLAAAQCLNQGLIVSHPGTLCNQWMAEMSIPG